jgi:hypothetical protein
LEKGKVKIKELLLRIYNSELRKWIGGMIEWDF